MTNDFILLGLLFDGPKHGYQIKKLIRDINSRFSNIQTTSIYYPLRQLEKRGLIRKNIGRKGRRPEKYTYNITDAGSKILEKLLVRNFLTLQRPFINLDLSLYFVPMFRKGVIAKCLKERLRGLTKIEKWLKKTEASFTNKKMPIHLRLIIIHNLELMKTEIRFTEYILKVYGR